MKISYVSDLHLEFGNIALPGGDVLILAGDICEIRKLKKQENNYYKEFFNNELTKYNKVLYVLGNHEYYSDKMHKTIETLQKILPSNTVLLNNKSIEIDGILFLGGTLWTDYHKNNLAMLNAKDKMNDYKCITVKNLEKGTYHKLYAKYVLGEHYKTKMFFLNELEKNKNEENPKDVVIISHHAPHKKSLDNDDHIKGDDEAYYYSDFTEVMEKYDNIKYWVHGHIHSKSNYQINNTKVLANPRGYKGYNKTADNYEIESFEIENKLKKQLKII